MRSDSLAETTPPAAVQGSEFSLVKWYIDCVDRHGRVVIAYWATVAWRGLSFHWHSVELHERDRPVSRRWSLEPTAPPEHREGRVAWQAPSLRCAVTSDVRQAPFVMRLSGGESGVVDWAVEGPVGCVAVVIEGVGTVRGDGYAERLELTVPPWRLPITELRWGRCVSSDAARSVVWIDWRGSVPRSWVVVDGRVRPEARVTDGEVCGEDFRLALVPERRLVHRALAEVLQPYSTLRSLLPDSLAALSESKWLGTGQFFEHGAPTLSAPALYEVVRMG